MYPSTLQLTAGPVSTIHEPPHASILVFNAGARAAPGTRQRGAAGGFIIESGLGLYTPPTNSFFTEPEYCDPVIIT